MRVSDDRPRQRGSPTHPIATQRRATPVLPFTASAVSSQYLCLLSPALQEPFADPQKMGMQIMMNELMMQIF